MRYTTDDKGILNNYAVEPAIYTAEYPSAEQQERYAFQGAVAILLVALTIFTAFAAA